MGMQKFTLRFVFPAGAIQSGTSDPIDIRTAYSAEIFASVNQSQIPTTPASITPQWSPDGSKWLSGQTLVGPINQVGEWDFPLIEFPTTAQAVRLVYAASVGPAGNQSVIDALCGMVIGV